MNHKRGNIESELKHIYYSHNVEMLAIIGSTNLYKIAKCYERLIKKVNKSKPIIKRMYFCNNCKSQLISNQVGCAYKRGKDIVTDKSSDFNTMRFIEKGWNFCKECNSDDIDSLDEDMKIVSRKEDNEATLKIFN